MKNLARIVGFSLAVAIGAPAWAQSGESTPRAPTVDTAIGLSIGPLHRVITPSDHDTLKLGVDFRVLYGMAQAGVLVEATLPIDWGNVNSVGGMLGVQFAPGELRIDLLGVVGMHWYNGAGGKIVLGRGSEPGISASIPFVGTRIGLSWESRARRPFGLGALFLMEVDLDRFESTYTFTHVTCDRNCPTVPPTDTVTRTVAFGETHFGLLFRVYWRF
ncbi:MAG: hypothetical protein R3A48_19860 [Polyangiales bacterium]